MVSGVLAGLFGIGGGLVIVPVLVFLFTAHGIPTDLVMIMAIATSLATIILTASSSVLAHHRLGSVLWDKVFRLVPGVILGAILGAAVAGYINAGFLKAIFIVFLLYVGIQMALKIQPKTGSADYSKQTDFGLAGARAAIFVTRHRRGNANRTLFSALPIPDAECGRYRQCLWTTDSRRWHNKLHGFGHEHPQLTSRELWLCVFAVILWGCDRECFYRTLWRKARPQATRTTNKTLFFVVDFCVGS
jgi:Sulfite exporter TauE/SafE